jgi:hypothetical protein
MTMTLDVRLADGGDALIEASPAGPGAQVGFLDMAAFTEGDGRTDDGPGITRGFALAVVLGLIAYFPRPAVAYHIATTVSVPNGLTMTTAGARVAFTTAVPGAGATDAAFLAQPGAPIITTTLTTSNVVGTNVVNSAASIPAGSIVALTVAGVGVYRGGFYKVIAPPVASGGGWNLTLDRAVLYQFAMGDNCVSVQSIPENITLGFNRASLSGTCVRYIELVGARDCTVDGVRINASAGACTDFCMSLDVGGYRSCYSRCDVDMHNPATGAGQSTGAYAFESPDSCWAWQCTALSIQYPGPGIVAYDAVGRSGAYDCSANLCGTGLFLTGQGDTLGCNGFTIDGGNYDGNVSLGVQVSDGTSHTRGSNFTASYNGSVGVDVDGTGTTMQDNRFQNFAAIGNTSYGLNVGAGAKTTRISACDLSGNGSLNILASDDLYAAQVSMNDAVAATRITCAGGIVAFDELDLVSGTNVPQNVFLIEAGTVYLDKSRMLIGHSSNGINNSGTLHIGRTLIGPAVSSSGEIGIVQSAGSLFVEPGTDPGACATPLSIASGNVAMVQVGGVAAVTVTGALTFAQNMNTSIELAVGAAGNATITCLAVPGLTFAARNNSAAHTLTVQSTVGGSVTVASSKAAMVSTNSLGAVQRDSPDT